MPVRKRPNKAAKPSKKGKGPPKTLTTSQHKLNHVFAAGRAALRRPVSQRTAADKAAIKEFTKWAPAGEARRIGSGGLAKKRGTYK